MSCEVCSCVVGVNYLVQGTCGECGASMSGLIGEYLGRFGNLHRFRLHPRVPCPGCNQMRHYSNIPCDNMLDVTEEFAELSGVEDEHWIGKNARR